jgi:hypothetical protein
MAKTSTATLTVSVSGDGVAANYTVSSTNNAAPGGGPTAVALSSGNNTITGPAGTTGALVVPPAGSMVAKVLKGVNGDTGIALSNTLPFFVSAASFVINAASGETVQIFWT